MAITDERSVLILGAGVSAPFVLPLGNKVIDLIHESLGGELQKIGDDQYSSALEARMQRQAFNRYPIHGAVASKFDIPVDNADIKEDLSKLKALYALLSSQTSETIDDFIVENPSYAELVKICISVEFFNAIYRHNEILGRYEINEIVSRVVGKDNERNWIHLLINIVRQGIRLNKISNENKIEIITFNYDKVLEYVLSVQFNNTENLEGKDWKDHIEIIHVHGECGELVDNITMSPPAPICVEWAKGICVVHEEPVPEKIMKQRLRAQAKIRSARELYFCGFAFAPANCRLLQLEKPETNIESREITYCNYDGNVGITKLVEKYDQSLPLQYAEIGEHEVPTYVVEESGSKDKPLSVSDWLKLGSVGELP